MSPRAARYSHGGTFLCCPKRSSDRRAVAGPSVAMLPLSTPFAAAVIGLRVNGRSSGKPTLRGPLAQQATKKLPPGKRAASSSLPRVSSLLLAPPSSARPFNPADEGVLPALHPHSQPALPALVRLGLPVQSQVPDLSTADVLSA